MSLLKCHASSCLVGATAFAALLRPAGGAGVASQGFSLALCLLALVLGFDVWPGRYQAGRQFQEKDRLTICVCCIRKEKIFCIPRTASRLLPGDNAYSGRASSSCQLSHSAINSAKIKWSLPVVDEACSQWRESSHVPRTEEKAPPAEARGRKPGGAGVRGAPS